MFTIRLSSSILTLSAAFGASASVCADNGSRVGR